MYLGIYCFHNKGLEMGIPICKIQGFPNFFFLFLVFLFVFSTGLVWLYIAGLPLRYCHTIGAPSVQGSAQCAFFRFWLQQDSNPRPGAFHADVLPLRLSIYHWGGFIDRLYRPEDYFSF